MGSGVKHRLQALLLAVAVVAGCNRAPAPPPAPPIPVMGTRWVIEGGDEDAPTIEFLQNRANGYGGCNRWFAQVDAGAATLRFGVVSATKLLCSPQVMTDERAFFDNLEATRTARIDGDTLILSDETGAERERFTRTR
jgi:putative lipoprotein